MFYYVHVSSLLALAGTPSHVTQAFALLQWRLDSRGALAQSFQELVFP